MSLTLHVDGGARGNPGPAGAGVVIANADGEAIYEAGFYLGKLTNNAAEYTALIRGLSHILAGKPQAVAVHSDSELLVRQLTGAYRVKSPSLQPLFEQAQLLLLKLPRWSVKHVRREQNRRADELANLAMDQQRDVVVLDAAAGIRAEIPPVVASAASKGGREESQASAAGDARSTDGIGPRVSVTLDSAPPADCPAGDWAEPAYVVEARLPEGMCVHAALALLPTLIAIQATDPADVHGIPTMTVRCSRRGCTASFLVSPAPRTNGAVH